ncbi:MAG: sigma 54-interacting transcriptional regulator [Flavobacterium sp.]
MNIDTKILIVEDQFVEANHLRLMLKNAGYTVTGIARTADEARKLIEKDKPALVLLDIFLSGKETGIDLAKNLREENIAFIYLSANSNEDILNMAKATRPYGFLVKPFREKDLFVTMEIARYHHFNSIESYVRKETFFQKQLKMLSNEPGTWEERLLKISIGLQPLIPFDLIVAIYKTGTDEKNNIVGFQRTGFKEYRKIGTEEFQNISGLKEHELKDLQDKTIIDEEITLYAGADFRKSIEKPSMKRLIAENMGMRSNLTLPIPLKFNKGDFFFSFFSRNQHGFSHEHMVNCERLQEILIYNVEGILSQDNGTFSKQLTNEERPQENTTEDKSVSFSNIIGRSPSLLTIFDFINQVASSETTVMITGESGTGKESIAASIHNLSPRKEQPLIKVNCSALPAGLIESELFGHEKGAFTNASDRRIGKFEQANKGTLFLDEIGEMPLEMQVKLLRALQEKEIERVGGKGSIKVDVRIVAATNKNLEKEVAEGRFRLDLYYRLNVFPIHLPPLRERKDDISLLVSHFIKKYNHRNHKAIERISQNAMKSLLSYNWPGNIRELENLIERGVLLAKANVIEEIPLPKTSESDIENDPFYIKTIEENEREHIIAVLNNCNGRIRGPGGAAELLGVPATTLASKMLKLGIKRL